MSNLSALHGQSSANNIERELARYGVALGIDWSDPASVEAAVDRYIAFTPAEAEAAAASGDRTRLSWAQFAGLAAMMFETMTDGAEDGLHVHGGPVWKTFAKAVYRRHGR